MKITNWDEIREKYITEGLSAKQLSHVFGVPEGTIKNKKYRDEAKGIMWTRLVDSELVEANKESREIIRQMTAQEIRDAKSKVSAEKALNVAKYLPSELWELMNDIEGMTVVDHLWAQIKMSFAGIIRAHKIMWVSDAESVLSAPVSESAEGSTFKVMFAFERYESYIRTMTRAYKEHNAMIEQFLKLADKDDPRRVKVIHMDLNVDKLEAETELAKLKVQEAKGLQKDTSMLEVLVDSQKQFEEMFSTGDFSEFEGGK